MPRFRPSSRGYPCDLDSSAATGREGTARGAHFSLAVILLVSRRMLGLLGSAADASIQLLNFSKCCRASTCGGSGGDGEEQDEEV